MGNSTLNCIIQSDERNCQDWGFASFCEKAVCAKKEKRSRKEIPYKPNIMRGLLLELSKAILWNSWDCKLTGKTDVFPWRIVCKNQKNQGVILNINTGQIL